MYLQKKVANNNGVIRSCNSTKDKQHNGQKIKRQTMMYKKLHRKLKKNNKTFESSFSADVKRGFVTELWDNMKQPAAILVLPVL